MKKFSGFKKLAAKVKNVGPFFDSRMGNGLRSAGISEPFF
jgi:hypothetical protein